MKSVLDIEEPVSAGLVQDPSGCNAHCQLQHQIAASFDQIEGQQEWDEFVERTGGDLYSTFDWCRIWWRYYGSGRSLAVHLFRREGKIVAIIPMFRESLRIGPISLRVLRLVGCDHSTTTCGVVIESKHLDAVMSEFSRWLQNDRDWEMMHWGPLAGYFLHRESLGAALTREASWNVKHAALDEPHILWDLPESFDEYLARLHKKERSNIKICRKKLGEDAAIYDAAASPEDLESCFPKFVEQHRLQWQAEGKLGHFDDWPRASLFHVEQARTMHEHGRLWLLRLDAEGEPIGFQYNYCFNRRVHWLLGSRALDPRYDTYSSGRLLHAETIEQAIHKGMVGIDGLRGMYEYKLRLGGIVSYLQDITLIRKGLWIEFKLGCLRFFSSGLHLLYYRIWFSRIAPKLGSA